MNPRVKALEIFSHALEREPHQAASHQALSRQAKRAARERKAAGPKAVGTGARSRRKAA